MTVGINLLGFHSFPKAYRILAIIFIFSIHSTFGQQSGDVADIVAVGDDAIVGNGFTSFTVGQVAFDSDNFVSMGVQQPYYNFAPTPKVSQKIVGFGGLSVLTVGGIYQILGVTGGGSGNAVVFASSNPNALNVVGNAIAPLSSGVFTITASQLGNSAYLDAVPVAVAVTVLGTNALKLNQLIVSTLPSPIVLNIGDSLILFAVATSGLAVNYATDNQTIVSISGSVLYAVSAGSAHLFINQSGNATYFAAPQFDIPILINELGLPPSTTSGIFGSGTVTPGTNAGYKQSLTGKGYTYQWSFSPDQSQVTFVGGTTSSGVNVVFNPGAQSGTISCAVYDADGNLIQYSTIPVNVDNSVSTDVAILSNQLPDVSCVPKPSDCHSSFIKSFSIGKLTNQNSGCSPSGYGDFANSGKLDSLYMGESYDASIASGGTEKAYFGIWVDYNKNGNFGDPGEFAGSSLESDSVFKIPNLLIGNDPDFVGPRRLRIKMQTTGLVSASQSCQEVGGEGGETEDYLIYIQQADRLKAPNVITPNNDGKNDLFVIRGIDAKKPNYLLIVNRWGNKVYDAAEYKNDWDGKDLLHHILPRGTYFYFFTNGADKIQGFVEVITE